MRSEILGDTLCYTMQMDLSDKLTGRLMFSVRERKLLSKEIVWTVFDTRDILANSLMPTVEQIMNSLTLPVKG
jgi:hypothetical protein